MNSSFVYIIPFSLTIFIEFLVNLVLLKNRFSIIFFYTLLINLVTWPLANILYGQGFNFYLLEFFIFLTEALLILLLFRVKISKALVISFIGNSITALLSYLI